MIFTKLYVHGAYYIEMKYPSGGLRSAKTYLIGHMCAYICCFGKIMKNIYIKGNIPERANTTITSSLDGSQTWPVPFAALLAYLAHPL